MKRQEKIAAAFAVLVVVGGSFISASMLSSPRHHHKATTAVAPRVSVPAAPPEVTAHSADSVLITWKQHPNDTVTSWLIYRDGVLAGSTQIAQFNDTLISSGRHVYKIVAMNGKLRSKPNTIVYVAP